MAEPLSDARLAELARRANEFCNCGTSDCEEGTQYGLTPNQANELLAEVQRLRSLEDSYIVALDQANVGDIQRLARRAETAERALADLTPEFGIRATYLSGRIAEYTVADNLAAALVELDRFDAKRGPDVVSRQLMQRTVGEWKAVNGG